MFETMTRGKKWFDIELEQWKSVIFTYGWNILYISIINNWLYMQFYFVAFFRQISCWGLNNLPIHTPSTQGRYSKRPIKILVSNSFIISIIIVNGTPSYMYMASAFTSIHRNWLPKGQVAWYITYKATSVGKPHHKFDL